MRRQVFFFLQQNAECQLVNIEKTVQLENHNSVTIIAKIGLGKNHQRMLNLRGNFVEKQNTCIVLKSFSPQIVYWL